MNVKVQCGCGARYSFEVEPTQGRMPFAMKCPTCGADGTDAANAIIAESSGPKLRVQMAEPVAVAVPEAGMPESPDTVRAVQEMLRHKKAREARRYRLGLWVLGVVVAAALAVAGFWGWYWFAGSKPSMIYQTSFGGSQGEPAVEFIATNQFLLVDAQHAVLHDVKADKDLWTAPLSGLGSRKPQIFAHESSVWICLGNVVAQLDAKTGSVKNTVEVMGDFLSFTPADANILVVSSMSATSCRAMRIDLATGAVASQEVTIPRSEKHLLPNELPPNVQPTAAVLLSQALEEQKFNKPLDAMSSQFFSAGENLVELRVRLVEPKVTWVQSIKPKGPSLINGETTASTSAFGVADEVFNDLKRSQTGGVKAVDESRYEVKVRRWTGAEPVEWTGETAGRPAFFPLRTVDLVAGGKTLVVLDKQNRKMFQAALSYPVAERFSAAGAEPGASPALEGPGSLYFFDQGVLTAFDLPSGKVRWRLPTIGVTKVQLDAQGMLYIDTTSASPEDIQYSDQIRFDKIHALLLKADPRTGKILWQAQDTGADSFVAGKFVYATSSNMGGVPMALALGEALNQAPPEEPTHFHLYRIDPETGRALWDFYHQGAPQDLSFQDNKFVLRYEHDVQAWRFLAF
ncbi:MAG TPA: PQQ-binding-like beta-propeller repeat protein [Verrucomicrobiae bacterium]|jgi:outer membrane protein assembly factor BamB|nr:PQQ-binding-like beta-propeller repeat protein [Verrucomicrobiae bacterium]